MTLASSFTTIDGLIFRHSEETITRLSASSAAAAGTSSSRTSASAAGASGTPSPRTSACPAGAPGSSRDPTAASAAAAFLLSCRR